MSIIYPSSETATTVNRAVKNVMGTTTTTDGAVDDGLIITENLQPVVECTPGMDYKITDKAITGTPPLSFHAIAQHLFDWSLDGNTDSGDSVGDKTANIIDYNIFANGYTLDAVTGLPIGTAGRIANLVPIDVSQYNNVCITFESNKNCALIYSLIANDVMIERQSGLSSPQIIDTSNANNLYLSFYSSDSGTIILTDMVYVMGANSDTVTPYVPYGYDIPIVVNNTDTYHCYITDVLRKSNGDTPVYDTMSSDGTITRRVDTDGTPLEEPTTETYTAPDITVNWGWNTVDVDTTVSPSNMIINYKDD